MVTYSSNHGFQLYPDGEKPWSHSPDFEKLDTRTPIVDIDANKANYSPKSNALFFASDTHVLYKGSGTAWDTVGTLGGGGGGIDPATTEGIANTRDHVGPMRQGTANATEGNGVMFWAQGGLTFNSAVVHTDLTGLATNTLTIELAHYEGGIAAPTTVGSTSVTVSGGPERVNLSGLPAIPADGEYVLARRASPNGEVIPCWRIPDTGFGAAAYAEHTYDRIDFRKGTRLGVDGDFGAADYWYYFFDLQIGDLETRVTSPWSTDVDEIYMRPTDPEEEFANVSPRALWIDTS